MAWVPSPGPLGSGVSKTMGSGGLNMEGRGFLGQAGWVTGAEEVGTVPHFRFTDVVLMSSPRLLNVPSSRTSSARADLPLLLIPHPTSSSLKLLKTKAHPTIWRSVVLLLRRASRTPLSPDLRRRTRGPGTRSPTCASSTCSSSQRAWVSS